MKKRIISLGTFRRSTFHWSTRIIMHMGLGPIVVAGGNRHIGWAILFVVLFGLYEVNEDWWIKDGAWIDLSGLMIYLGAQFLWWEYGMRILNWWYS